MSHMWITVYAVECGIRFFSSARIKSIAAMDVIVLIYIIKQPNFHINSELKMPTG